MSAADDDWNLLARATEDEAALGTLFERHRHYVYRLAWGLSNEDHIADDVVQEVFLKMWCGRLEATPKAKFTTWLYKVALNTTREQTRLKRRSWRDKTVVNPFGGEADNRTDLTRVDTLQDLSLALSKLPARQREVVVLRFLEGFDTRETAEIMGSREGTVKAHLHRATENLRNFLSNHVEKTR